MSYNNTTVNNQPQSNVQAGSDNQAPNLFLAITTGILSLPGIPGNFLVMFLTLKNKEIYSETYTWLLFNLALVDFFFCFQGCFLQTIFIMKPQSIGCKIAGFLEYFTGLTSFFLPAFVAVNRYVKIIHGDVIYLKWFSKRKMILLNIFPWLWSGVFLSPYIIGGWLGPESLGLCGLQLTPSLSIYFILTTGVPIGITYYLVVFCYFKFREHLSSHAQNASYLRSPVVKESRSIMRATRFICYIPLLSQLPTVANKIILSTGLLYVNPWLTRVLAACFPLTSACNPYISLFVVKPYRAEVKKIWYHINNTTSAHPITHTSKTRGCQIEIVVSHHGGGSNQALSNPAQLKSRAGSCQANQVEMNTYVQKT